MAVTKIRKISSWTLLASAVISVAVLVIFYTGGVVNPGEEMKEYAQTNLLINWVYVLFGLTVLSTFIFALWQFINLFRTNAKSALTALGVLVGFAAIMLIAYSIGDGTPLPMINSDSAEYNTETWLKVTDMWIYSIYILIAMIVLAVVAGSVKRILNK
ncbi:MAG: hypothetical protein LUG51_04580 [Tannerellaceae bacterium]|nr:hypothetical protein [Tannerellaceae bacterium]